MCGAEPDEEGASALHHACDSGNVELVRLLIAEAADVLHVNAAGKTALALARIRWQGTSTLAAISDALLPAMEQASASLELMGSGALDVAYGSRARERRDREEEAALALAEVARADPGLAAHLEEVRAAAGAGGDDCDSGGGHAALVLAAARRLRETSAAAEKEQGNAALARGDAGEVYLFTALFPLFTSTSQLLCWLVAAEREQGNVALR